MKKFLKIAALLLTLLMIFPLAISCANNDGEQSDTSDSLVVDTNNGEKYDANGYLMDYIPDELDYGGMDVYILGWSDEPTRLDFFDGDLTGAKVEDAVFARNSVVQTRLNVNIVYELTPGNNTEKGNYTSKVTTNILGGSQPYDLLGSYSMVPVSLAIDGMLTEISSNQYLHFDAPWWNQSLAEGCSLGDSLYFVSGDLAPSTMLNAMAMFVNMEMVQNYQLEDPRELVKNGEWTLEKLFEMTKSVSSVGNAENDTYAIGLSEAAVIDAFLIGSDISYISKNRQGEYNISEKFESEKTFDLVSLIINNMYKGTAISRDLYGGDKAFKAEQCLIDVSRLTRIRDMRAELDFAYSFIPMPKYEYDGIIQDGYRTGVGFTHSMYSVPSNVKDVDLSCVLLECLASEGYRQLRPAMYEALKYQNSNEAIDAEMFDIVMDSITFDLGRIMHGVFDTSTDNAWAASPVALFRDRITKNDPNFYSAIKSHQSTINKRLDSLNQMVTQN